MLIKVSTHHQYNSKPLESWSNRDFLIYFADRYSNYTSKSFKIQGKAWIGMTSRIKGFRLKMNLNNSNYKRFIDNVFNNFFTQDNYIPNFGSIVSEKVFYSVQKLLKNSNCTNDEFEKLREEIYSSELFKQLETI